MSSDPPLSGGVPPTTGQALPPNFMVSPELLFQFMQQMHQSTPAPEPQTLEMPAKGHLSAPKFDDKPVNLESYFSELEYHLDHCCITSTAECKIQALYYLDATPRHVWHGTDMYEDITASWKAFKKQIFRLYPGSEGEQRINLTDIFAYIDANAHGTYPNEWDLGV